MRHGRLHEERCHLVTGENLEESQWFGLNSFPFNQFWLDRRLDSWWLNILSIFEQVKNLGLPPIASHGMHLRYGDPNSVGLQTIDG